MLTGSLVTAHAIGMGVLSSVPKWRKQLSLLTLCVGRGTLARGLETDAANGMQCGQGWLGLTVSSPEPSCLLWLTCLGSSTGAAVSSPDLDFP